MIGQELLRVRHLNVDKANGQAAFSISPFLIHGRLNRYARAQVFP
jgi:hypothetical protein